MSSSEKSQHAQAAEKHQVTFEPASDGQRLVATILLRCQEVNTQTIELAASELESIASTLRAFVAGKAMVSDEATAEILFVPEGVHDPLPMLFRRPGGNA